MSDSTSVSQRLEFLKIDETTRAALAEFRPAIEAAVPASLKTFYAQVRRYPEVRQFFRDDGHIDHAASAQENHWKRIAGATFDGGYVQSVQRIGMTHARIGLEPRWYIGGYTIIMDEIVRRVTAAYFARKDRPKKDDGRKLAETLAAVIKVSMLDIDLGVSTYLAGCTEMELKKQEAAQAAKAEEAALNAGKLAALDRSQAIIEFGLDGTVQNANENFCQTLGYTLQEIRGRHHSMFVDANYRQSPEYRHFWDALGRGEFQSGKYHRVGKGGREVWIQASYNPIVDGNGKPFKVVKFASDITGVENERKVAEAERATRASEQSAVVSTVGSGLKELAGGNLTTRLAVPFAAEYESLRSDFNEAMAKIQSAMTTIANATGGIQTGAAEISNAADDLSRRTEQQAASLEQTAAALDEITATVKKSAEGATAANNVVATARADGEASGEVVRKAVAAMGEIERSAKQISQIIGVIDEIAFQTNLLALNAGVEAARAGDAGRGFAVVASEVRALAQRSADAAKQIKGLISESSQQVEDGVELVGQAGDSLVRILEQIGRINKLVSEISASSQEQSTGLSQVNSAVNQMDQVTQQNAAMVEQSTAASRSLAREASELAALVAEFKIGDRAATRSARASHAEREAPPPPASRRAVPQMRSTSQRKTLPASSSEADWEEF